MLLPIVLAFFGAGGATAKIAQPQPRIAGQLLTGAPASSTERLVFNARSSTAYLNELESFLSETAVADSYATLLKTFSDVASEEGVASAPSGNLVDIAYDWIDRNEWKFFVRLEVDFPAFEALFEAAKKDSVYRAVAAASLIYGGQGILDFKHNVPDYIDSVHQQQDFQSIKFSPQNKKHTQWAYRLALRQVDLQMARYRVALAYLERLGIDDRLLQKKAGEEQNPRLRAILLHYADLLRSEAERVPGSDDFRLRIAILLSDVERSSPELVRAVLRIGEKNKQVIFNEEMTSYDADCAAFRFLVEQPSD